ncbi:RNA-directed DNA polymerase from mobile element jockey [Merluccius polli]|uniref:RNA-directed DNA polymerase from mobile element jockey n=1 Tax=Merluccius polli TaxID=89951 RepID=A0AA47MJ24_MERPO|nr:RNA-directed DNA polymerase from mobile element jockey [Merluccius polli]
MILAGPVTQCMAEDPINNSGLRTYSCSELLGLRESGTLPSPGLLQDVPGELCRHHGGKYRRSRARKRGRRGGIRWRIRSATKLPLPPMLLCNPRSLKNKLDDLRQQVGACYEYRESGIMAFTETWFGKDVPDNFIQIEGFSHVRLDRDVNSGKLRGGGVCIYINDSWCRNLAVRDRICTPDLELLCVTLRPHYLPPGIYQFVCVRCLCPTQRTHHSSLNKTLPGFDQYVKCSTRNNNILETCYGNIKDAYTARARPPLKNSDHNTVKVWTNDKLEELKGCFLCTDWDIFLKDTDIDSATEATTDYINFCIESVIPTKTIKRYPNNKSYFTPDIMDCIKRKKGAFKSGDKAAVRAAQKDLNLKITSARHQHKERAEQNLAECNTKKLWDSIRHMTNMDAKKKPPFAHNEITRANELNNFYMRFNVDNSADCADVLESVICDLNVDIIEIDLETVIKTFKTIQTKKATGPDGLSAFILKSFAQELSPVWVKLFQFSMDTYTVPRLWKKSIILPIPKKVSPQEDNDYRPVAITSNAFKSLEKIMIEKLQTAVEPALDKYQFAYTKNRTTSDAIATVMHLVLKHLENPAGYARLLFVDFSAFNLIQPHILLKKLVQLNVNPFLIRWYYSFLSNRPQQVKFNSALSDLAVCSTGAPQGCVSSPFLFTLYTNDCVSSEPNQFTVKFSDDTVILSLLTKHTNLSVHQLAVDKFVNWCDAVTLAAY